MKKERITLNKLLYNNRFILFFSIILSFLIWLVVAIEFSPEVERVVESVPVKIDLSNSVKTFNLQIFGEQDFTVDITVVGKRYAVSSSALSADDFSVTAKTNYVDSAGKQTLQLEVVPKLKSADYEITNVSEEYIEVYFDIFKEGEFTLVPEIEYPEKAVPDGYFKDKEVLSAKTVTVSGPATEINKIKQVSAIVKVDKTLTATKTFKAEIVPTGEFGSTLRYLTINSGNDDISITIPVYKLAELPVTVSFKNIPAFYLTQPLEFTCTPTNGSFAINEDTLGEIKKLNIGMIDFSELKAGINNFIFSADDIADAKVMDGTKQFKVIIDISEMTESKLAFKQNNITLLNVPSNYNVTLTGSGISSITIVGPKNEVKTVTNEDVVAEVNLQDLTLTNDTKNAKARLYIKNHDACWVYGNYSVGITVSAKQ